MRERALLFIVALVFLAACQQQAVVPTLAPTALAPTATTGEAATQPPPPTALPRPTLPPTWTPAPEVTNTPPPTPDLANGGAVLPQETPVIAPTLPEACNSFGPDPNRTVRTYKSGQDTTVYWVPVEGAEYYSVSLTDENDEIIFTDYTADTSYTFSADLIEDGKLYGWQVYPINPLGQQMCLTRGAELFPEYLN